MQQAGRVRQETTRDDIPANPAMPIWLAAGHHAMPEDGLNIMEAVSYVCGYEHSSYPHHVCPVLTEFALLVADSATCTERQSLCRYILPLACATASESNTFGRLFHATDFVVRHMASSVMRVKLMFAEARVIESLGCITDAESATKAQAVLSHLVVGSLVSAATLPAAHLLRQLEQLVEAAATAHTSEGDAFSVILQLRNTLARLELGASPLLNTSLFVQKRILLEQLLCFGFITQTDAKVLGYRKARLVELGRMMQVGVFGRDEGASLHE